MKKENFSIIVRFAMTKGDGIFPDFPEFSEEEIAEPQSVSSFFLIWDPESINNDLSDLIIHECIVLYDGISRSETLDYGLFWKKDQLCGYPAPIVEFIVSRTVDPDDFKQCVWSSGYQVCPASRDENETDPFVFEDHNGYTSVINSNDKKAIVTTLKKAGVFSGKTFTFQQMEDGVIASDMIS
jgi:hypothetical protein